MRRLYLRGGLLLTAALILAAGASTRLGSPKQLVEFAGEALLDRTVRIAHEAACSPILVVLGASAALIEQRCNLRAATILHNKEWFEGMASSIRQGINALSQTAATGAVILSCDMPSVTSAHIRALVACGTLTASRYSDRNGVPAYFPQAYFEALLTLQGDQGARNLLKNAPSTIHLPQGELDIDTPGDVSAMLRIEQAAHAFSN